MCHRIGDLVRLRPGSAVEERLAEAAHLTGIIGDVWTDHRGEHVSVVYEDAQVYAFGWAAADFVPALALADAPF